MVALVVCSRRECSLSRFLIWRLIDLVSHDIFTQRCISRQHTLYDTEHEVPANRNFIETFLKHFNPTPGHCVVYGVYSAYGPHINAHL